VALRAERIWEAKVLPAMAPVDWEEAGLTGGLVVGGRKGAIIG